MQGVILSVGRAQSLILGDDGLRYTFTPLDWQNDDISPAFGMRVDFEIRGSHAVAVYPSPDTAFTPDVQSPHAPPTQSPFTPMPNSSPPPAEPHTTLHEAGKRFGTKWWRWVLAGGGAFMFLGIIGMVVLGSFTTSDPLSDTESVSTTTEVPSTDTTQSRQADLQAPTPTTDAAPPVSTQPPGPTPAAQEGHITPVADGEVAEDTAASGQESQSRELATPEKRPLVLSTPEATSIVASPVSVQPTPFTQPPFRLEWETSGEYASETSARVDWLSRSASECMMCNRRANMAASPCPFHR